CPCGGGPPGAGPSPGWAGAPRGVYASAPPRPAIPRGRRRKESGRPR
ncbi:MAG: hypothetical protein AVDCRST_MAG54-1336, partial [uncultured Actinomycetospora sp.]